MPPKTEKTEKQYKIVQLEAENVKRLKAVSITPEGNIIEITGDNGNGKTSLLDSIYWALTGKDKKTQKSPIRAGEDKATIHLDLGPLVIRRTFAAKDDGDFTTGLILESEDGARYQKPQDILNAISNELSFDPLEFTTMKPAEQFDELKRFVPDFDFAKDAAARKADFDARTDVNRRTSDLEAQAKAIVVGEDVPDEEIDVTALSDQIQEIISANADIDRRKNNRDRVTEEAQRLRETSTELTDRATVLRKQADDLDKQAEEKLAEAVAHEKRLAEAPPLPEYQDPAAIREKMNAAGSINEKVREKKRLADLQEAISVSKERADELTAAIKARDEAKAKVIASAKMPIEGLGFGDGYVTLNGQPFDQASKAEQIRTGVALAIAANPRLRVILIRDGSLLDKNAWKILSETAEVNDFQIWVETVSSGRPGAIVIEDGSVKTGE